MEKLLYAAGTSFLRAFGVTFLFAVSGILAAPNRAAAIALSWAALAASVAFGLRSIQVFVPRLSWAGLFPQPWAAYLDAFTRGFLTTLITTVTGWLAAPDLSNWKAVWLGIFIGAGTAGARALQGFFTKGHVPAKTVGA